MPVIVIIAEPSSCRAERTIVRSGVARGAREPPIHHEHLAIFAEHDVRGLQIAMDDSLAVRKCDRVAHLLENREQHAERVLFQSPARARLDELQHIVQRDAAHEFHRVEDLLLLVHAEFIDGHNVRVLELAGDLRLLDESHQLLLRARVQHHLHRNLADPRSHPSRRAR